MERYSRIDRHLASIIYMKTAYLDLLNGFWIKDIWELERFTVQRSVDMLDMQVSLAALQVYLCTFASISELLLACPCYV